MGAMKRFTAIQVLSLLIVARASMPMVDYEDPANCTNFDKDARASHRREVSSNTLEGWLQRKRASQSSRLHYFNKLFRKGRNSTTLENFSVGKTRPRKRKRTAAPQPSQEPSFSMSPSQMPTARPSFAPSPIASSVPSSIPSQPPSSLPSSIPTSPPTAVPSLFPTFAPSNLPTFVPTDSPTDIPDTTVTFRSPLTFEPGQFTDNKRSSDGKIVLSNGLSAKPIAHAGARVSLANGSQSTARFHNDPDGAAVFPKPDGGWVYASNAENPNAGNDWQDGGVGSIEFNADGDVIGYQKVCSVTRNNCGGGRTPWDSWVTCEEISGGRVYQTDPYGNHPPVVTALGNLGMYESFAYDDGTAIPTFYVTRDDKEGVLTRFTPDARAMECYKKANPRDRWCTLSSGTMDYLLLSGGPVGTFKWTTDYKAAKKNAKSYYPMSEGIDIQKGVLYFTSKAAHRLVILNLRTRSYTYSSTLSGAFNNQPDQIARIVGDDSGIAYFCEDGGIQPGVFGRSLSGDYFTILYGDLRSTDETTGLAFSPDNMHMYVSFQNVGIIYDITRDDGRPFLGPVVDIKYHAA